MDNESPPADRPAQRNWEQLEAEERRLRRSERLGAILIELNVLGFFYMLAGGTLIDFLELWVYGRRRG